MAAAVQSSPAWGFFCCGLNNKPKHDIYTNPSFARPAVITPPSILETFLEARASGDVQSACDCCSDDITMRGPMGEFVGVEAVKTKAFGKPSQQAARILMPLQYQPHLSSETEALFAREFEAQIGYTLVPLRQEFTVRNPDKPFARVCLVTFSKMQQ